jgi:hypothetical protein
MITVGTPSTARRHQLVDGFAGRHQHFAAEMAALLGRRELIFEMHARRSGLDQRLGQFEGVQVAAETRFGIGNDGDQPLDRGLAVHVVNLIGAQQRVVDPLDHFRH